MHPLLLNMYDKHCCCVISHAIVVDTGLRLFPCNVERCIASKICLRPSSFEKEEREKAVFSSSVLRKEKCGSHMPTHSLPVIPPTSTDSSLFFSQLFVFLFSAPCFPHPSLLHLFSSSCQVVHRVSDIVIPVHPFPLTFFFKVTCCTCLCMCMSSQNGTCISVLSLNLTRLFSRLLSLVTPV